MKALFNQYLLMWRWLRLCHGRHVFAAVGLLLLSETAYSQTPTVEDAARAMKSAQRKRDISGALDTNAAIIPLDTLKRTDSVATEKLLVQDSTTTGKDDLDTVVVYSAKDSIVYDLREKRVRLNGAAKVTYQEFKLEAPTVSIFTPENLLNADASLDSMGYVILPAKFSDASGNYEAEKLAYNFKSRKGKIREVYTNIEQAYYRGDQIKRQETGELFINGGYYTTCNEDHWHYWFYCSQMKLVPNERVFARPVVLYIEGVPVFVLPYAFFPTQRSSGRASGIIMPNYGFDNTRGFTLARGGYYWAISDFTDLKFEGDFGTRGSWRLGSQFRYALNGEFRGRISGEFQRLFFNESGDPDYRINESWNMIVEHSQELTPYTRITANLNFSSLSTVGITSINPSNIFNLQATSTARLDQIIGDNEGSLSLGFIRNQSLETSDVSNNINFTFAKTRFFPFRSKKSDGTSLFDQFGIDPRLSIDAFLRDTDTTSSRDLNSQGGFSFNLQFRPGGTGFLVNLSQSINLNTAYRFTTAELDRSGVQLTAPISAGITVPALNLNLSSSLNFNYSVADRTIERFVDTAGSVVTLVRRSPESITTYGINLSAQTRLYGILFTGALGNLIGLKALRHTLIPNLSYNYNPDFTSEKNSYFASYVDQNGNTVRYNRFEGAFFGGVPGESQSLSLSLSNVFDAKIKTLDTTKAIDDPARTEKNIQFLLANISGGYNFAASEFNVQPISISASSNTLAPLFTLNGSAQFDYYGTDSAGTRINQSYQSLGGGLLRFISADLGFSMSLRGERGGGETVQNQDSLRQSEINAQANVQQRLIEQTNFGRNFGQNVDFEIPWDLSLNGSVRASQPNPFIPIELQAQINISGAVSITKNWKLSMNTGYNFTNAQFIVPNVRISRDFHCWSMSFQWVPIGQFKSYFFQLNLKAPELQDIRIEKASRPAGGSAAIF
ncbi:MAG: putative LPS assembly protein LptD [Chloroherpetonaceae bacterium]|nr:putative LPS assembly protein LptD [Chloroherpetonaceae bacterium]